MNKADNENGFIIETLLLILLIALIVIAGWFVHKNHHKSHTSGSAAVTDQAIPTAASMPGSRFD